jgi:hypothetical protein
MLSFDRTRLNVACGRRAINNNRFRGRGGCAEAAAAEATVHF